MVPVDLSQYQNSVSIPPDEAGDGSTGVDGAWVDCSSVQGVLQYVAACGAATGSPTSFSQNFSVQEADDSSGTNAQVVANQDEVTLTADDTVGVGRAHLTKPYARIRILAADDVITGGSSPTVPVTAIIQLQKTRS